MKFFLAVILAISASVFAERETARLLVNIESESSFTPKEFAEASSAYLLNVDSRNPFKDLNQVYLQHDFIVLSTPIEKKKLRALASRFGFRSISLLQENIHIALEQTAKLLRENPKHSSQIESIPREEGPVFYDLLKKVDQIFTEHKIIFWAHAGTLLGAVRHQGIIPWDDDIDVCILDSDEKAMVALKDELEQQGLGLYYSEEKDFYKIFNLNGALIKNVWEDSEDFHPYRYPFVDVFVMTLACQKEAEDRYVYKSYDFYWYFPNETFAYSQIEGIHRVPFGPLMIPIPSEAEAWLDRNYGIPSDPQFWKKYALEPTWCHRTEDVFPYSGASYVELDDFSPVPWD